MTGTGIVILAAGNSSRLGKPKQLLLHQNKTLLRHSVDEALDARLGPVAVVLGHNAETIAKNISERPLQIVFNPQWQEGLASSISTGLSDIVSRNPPIQSVILAVCDQPFLTASVFQQLLTEHLQTGKGIVASSYADTVGTPALFHRRYFQNLLQLNGAEGAKRIMQFFRDDVTTISFPNGNIDIDTAEDYDRFVAW